VKERNEQIETLLAAAAKRLIARAGESRSLDALALVPRIKAAVEKYLLKDDENASSKAIDEFCDGLQADDLCLIVACERGDETAWTDLVARFTTTVRSAARSASSNEDAAEDLAQSIWAELYGLRVRSDGKPSSKLAYYSGRGSLAGWLRDDPSADEDELRAMLDDRDSVEELISPAKIEAEETQNITVMLDNKADYKKRDVM